MVLEKYIIWFFLYSIMGWVYESLLCSVKAGKFVNRGFLKGCYCPIYGCGAILDLLFLGKIENPVGLFLLGAVLACTIEYFTSYLLEKFFKMRWWDYSYMKFNINGRICLIGAIVFGILSVLLIMIIHPIVEASTLLITAQAKQYLAAVFSIIILGDSMSTLQKIGYLQQTKEKFAFIKIRN